MTEDFGMDHNNDRNVVVPGDLLSDDPKASGEGTYVKDGKFPPSSTGWPAATRIRCG